MAITYGDMCNKVIRAFNDVELTSITFPNTIGFQSVVKDAVNYAMRKMHENDNQWPFNHVTNTQTLVPLTPGYTFPVAALAVDWNTFVIKRDDTIPVSASWLRTLEYDDYIRSWYSQDAQDDVGNAPNYVFKDQTGNWGVSPKPDKAYTVQYEYWQQPLDLVNFADTTTIPDRYEYVIVYGAMSFCYRFRQNKQNADDFEGFFTDGIKTMRKNLMNSYIYVMDTRAPGR